MYVYGTQFDVSSRESSETFFDNLSMSLQPSSSTTCDIKAGIKAMKFRLAQASVESDDV